jgi:uroporphyrinogen decarboxylase
MDPASSMMVFMHNLGLDWGFPMVNIAIAEFPLAEEEVLDKTEERELYRDEYGRVGWRLRRQTSMTEYVSYLVSDRESWEGVRERYVSVFDARDRYWSAGVMGLRYVPMGLTVGSFFGELRALLGFERLCTLLYDDPEFVKDMLGFLTEEMLRRMDGTDHLEFDFAKFWEDMAYQEGSFISPAMWTEFLRPCYARVVDALHSRGIDVVMVDCDGDVTGLIPLWLDVGVNCPYPMEARYHDLLVLKKQYGQDLLMCGGVNKFALMGDRKWIEREVFGKVRYLIRQGGYIPMVDHAVPPEVSLENYRYFRRLMAVVADEVGWDV